MLPPLMASTHKRGAASPTRLNPFSLDLAALSKVVQINYASSARRSRRSLTSGSCRDGRAAAPASPASTSPTGWISYATPPSTSTDIGEPGEP